MTNLSPGDTDVKKFNSAIRQLYAGGSNNTGTVTLRASQTTTVVNHESCNPKSHISLTPTTASAAAAMQPTTVLTSFTPKLLSFTRVLTAAGGNVAYTGVGFKPSLVQFMCGLPGGSDVFASIGQSDGTTNTCLSMAAGTEINFFSAAGIMVDAISAYQSFVIASMDSSGFTLTWSKTGSPTSTQNCTATCFPPADAISSAAGGVEITARTTGSFTITHPSNAASDQTFTYSVTGGA
jgi:hypothetical protein